MECLSTGAPPRNGLRRIPVECLSTGAPPRNGLRRILVEHLITGTSTKNSFRRILVERISQRFAQIALSIDTNKTSRECQRSCSNRPHSLSFGLGSIYSRSPNSLSRRSCRKYSLRQERPLSLLPPGPLVRHKRSHSYPRQMFCYNFVIIL